MVSGLTFGVASKKLRVGDSNGNPPRLLCGSCHCRPGDGPRFERATRPLHNDLSVAVLFLERVRPLHRPLLALFVVAAHFLWRLDTRDPMDDIIMHLLFAVPALWPTISAARNLLSTRTGESNSRSGTVRADGTDA